MAIGFLLTLFIVLLVAVTTTTVLVNSVATVAPAPVLHMDNAIQVVATSHAELQSVLLLLKSLELVQSTVKVEVVGRPDATTMERLLDLNAVVVKQASEYAGVLTVSPYARFVDHPDTIFKMRIQETIEWNQPDVRQVSKNDRSVYRVPWPVQPIVYQNKVVGHIYSNRAGDPLVVVERSNLNRRPGVRYWGRIISELNQPGYAPLSVQNLEMDLF